MNTTMDSSSSGGLRRRQAVETNPESNKSSSAANDLNDNFKDGTGDEDNMEEASDKETRLTLMEEVLLLGLKDKEVSIGAASDRRVMQCDSTANTKAELK